MLSLMGLVTIRQKQTLLGYAFVILIVLGVIGLSIRFWYVTIPLVMALVVIAVSVRTRRNKPQAPQHVHVERVAAVVPRPPNETTLDLVIAASRLVVDARYASDSYLQRKLRIPFVEAQELMGRLETAGVVGKAEGIHARVVLITREQLDTVIEGMRTQR